MGAGAALRYAQRGSRGEQRPALATYTSLQHLEVLGRQPENPDALFGLGRAEEGLGLVDEAIARYRAVAARVPAHRAASRLAELEAAAR